MKTALIIVTVALLASLAGLRSQSLEAKRAMALASQYATVAGKAQAEADDWKAAAATATAQTFSNVVVFSSKVKEIQAWAEQWHQAYLEAVAETAPKVFNRTSIVLKAEGGVTNVVGVWDLQTSELYVRTANNVGQEAWAVRLPDGFTFTNTVKNGSLKQ